MAQGGYLSAVKRQKLFSEVFCRWVVYLLAQWSRYCSRDSLPIWDPSLTLRFLPTPGPASPRSLTPLVPVPPLSASTAACRSDNVHTVRGVQELIKADSAQATEIILASQCLRTLRPVGSHEKQCMHKSHVVSE